MTNRAHRGGSNDGTTLDHFFSNRWGWHPHHVLFLPVVGAGSQMIVIVKSAECDMLPLVAVTV